MACVVCSKGPRAVLYCHRTDCGLMIALPRPDVKVVQTEDGKSHVVISREGKGKSYEIEGSTPDEKIQRTVEKVISDGYTREWLP